jgi:tetratricopeptide (TPR) repeat protein
LELNENDRTALFWKAFVLCSDESTYPNKVLKELEKLVTLYPNDWVAWHYKGVFSRLAGKRNASLESLKKSISICAWNLNAMSTIAKIRQDQKKAEEALQVCEKILSLNPQSTATLMMQASLHDDLNKKEEALAIVNKMFHSENELALTLKKTLISGYGDEEESGPQQEAWKLIDAGKFEDSLYVAEQMEDSLTEGTGSSCTSYSWCY